MRRESTQEHILLKKDSYREIEERNIRRMHQIQQIASPKIVPSLPVTVHENNGRGNSLAIRNSDEDIELNPDNKHELNYMMSWLVPEYRDAYLEKIEDNEAFQKKMDTFLPLLKQLRREVTTSYRYRSFGGGILLEEFLENQQKNHPIQTEYENGEHHTTVDDVQKEEFPSFLQFSDLFHNKMEEYIQRIKNIHGEEPKNFLGLISALHELDQSVEEISSFAKCKQNAQDAQDAKNSMENRIEEDWKQQEFMISLEKTNRMMELFFRLPFHQEQTSLNHDAHKEKAMMAIEKTTAFLHHVREQIMRLYQNIVGEEIKALDVELSLMETTLEEYKIA